MRPLWSGGSGTTRIRRWGNGTGSRQDGDRCVRIAKLRPPVPKTGGARGVFARIRPAGARSPAARMCARRNGSWTGGGPGKGLGRSRGHIAGRGDGNARPGARSSAAPARYSVALARRATQGGPAGEGRSVRRHQSTAGAPARIPLQDIMIGCTSRPLPSSKANCLVPRNAVTGGLARCWPPAVKRTHSSTVDVPARGWLAAAKALPRAPVLGCLVRRVRTPRPPPQPVSVTAILLTPASAGMNLPDLKWISSRIRILSRPAGARGPWPPLRPVPGRRASPGSCARGFSPW